jgi:hypothetical protein
MAADQVAALSWIGRVFFPWRLDPYADAADIPNFVILQQDVIELCRNRVPPDPKNDAAVVLVAGFAGDVVDQAIAHHEVLMKSAVCRGDVDPHSFRSYGRLVDQFEILDCPAARIPDIDDAHPLGIRRDGGAGGIAGSEVRDRYCRFRTDTTAPKRKGALKAPTSFKKNLITAVIGALFSGLVV